MSAPALAAAAELFRALGAPARLAILDALRTRPHCVHELIELTGASQPLVSQHLRVLRGARLVRSERRGREVEYALMDTHIGHLVGDALAHVAEPGGQGVEGQRPPASADVPSPPHEPATIPQEQP